MENQSSPRDSTLSRTLVHLLQVHTRCVPRHYFLGDVFLLFLQLFLITSFGYYIPRKPWQRQRCKEGRDKALIGTIRHTVYGKGTYPLHMYYWDVTKKQRRQGQTNLVSVPTLPFNCQLGDLRKIR